MGKKSRLKGRRPAGGRLERLRELYAELPTIECKGLCSNACGPIDMTDVERNRLVDLGVTIPVFTAADAAAWARGERLDCPALTEVTGHPLAPRLRMARCTVYEDRPLICRLWGMTESMRCEAGCEPSRVLSDREAYDLIFRAMEIGGHRHIGDLATYRRVKTRFGEFQDDPELGPLIQAFIRGDRTAEHEMVEALRRKGIP